MPGADRLRAGAGAPGGADPGLVAAVGGAGLPQREAGPLAGGEEEAFRHWGGVPQEVLVDNARALVSQHDPEREILVFAQRLDDFARYWEFKPPACRPYRARTKGKDERCVAYVKKNAMAGREFGSWAELEAHLVSWTREVADVCIHGSTGEAPLERFLREEAQAAHPLEDKPSFLVERELLRIVHIDCCVEVEANWYSAPRSLIRQRVSVLVRDQQVLIRYGGRLVAQHERLRPGSRSRRVIEGHWEGSGAAASAARGRCLCGAGQGPPPSNSLASVVS